MFGMIPFEHTDRDLYRSFDNFARDFFGSSNASLPAFRTDIQDKGESYLLEADLPGFTKEDINLDLKDNILTISATHQENTEDKDEKGTYVRQERRCGSFQRSFDVSGIDATAISAAYENGVLKLTLPKEQPTVPPTRRIEIH